MLEYKRSMRIAVSRETEILALIEQISQESAQFERFNLCQAAITDLHEFSLRTGPVNIANETYDLSNQNELFWIRKGQRVLESTLLPTETLHFSIASEGFSGTLRKLIDWIKRIITSIVDALKKLGHFLIDDASQLRFAIQDTRIKVRGKEGQTYVTQKVKLGRLGVTLESSLGIPEDYRQLMRGIVELRNQLNHVEVSWVKPILTHIDEINDPITRALRNELTDHDLAAFNAKTLSIINPQRLLSGFSRTSNVVDTQYGKDHAHSGPPLMGNRAIVVAFSPDISKQTTALEDAEKIQAISATLTRLVGEDPPDVSEFEMETMSPDELLEVLDVTEHILNHLDAKLVRDMISRIEKIQNYIETRSSVQEEQLTSECRVALSYATAYAKWLKNPYVSLVGLADTTVRSLLMLCKRHLHAYR